VLGTQRPIALEVESNKLGVAGGSLAAKDAGDRQGNTTKYSPILKELNAAAKRQFPAQSIIDS
jgi:hypothetical protein